MSPSVRYGLGNYGSGKSGLVTPGNIDLTKRPIVHNADGTTSTVRSMSFEDNGHEVLVPTVSDDGRIMSDDEAINTYYRTGKHLGIFTDPQSATTYAQQLHDAYANGQIPGYKAVNSVPGMERLGGTPPPAGQPPKVNMQPQSVLQRLRYPR